VITPPSLFGYVLRHWSSECYRGGAPWRRPPGFRRAGRGGMGMEQIPKTRWARTVDGTCIAYQDMDEEPVTLVVVRADAGGIAVHIGAPVAALASSFEVLVSSTVKELVSGSGLVFEDRGERDLKGVPERWRLYAAMPPVSIVEG
jgi:hypothetical protein